MKKWFAYIALGAVCLTAWRCSDKDYSDVTFDGVRGLYLAPGMSYTLPFSGGSGEYTVELLRYDSPENFASVSIAPAYGFAGWALTVETEEGIGGGGTIVITDTKSGKTTQCLLSVHLDRNFNIGRVFDDRENHIDASFEVKSAIAADLQSKSFPDRFVLAFNPGFLVNEDDCYGAGQWQLVELSEPNNVHVDTVATGTFVSLPLDLKNLPEAYAVFPIEHRTRHAERYVFEQENGQHIYDLLIVDSPGTSFVEYLLYEDLTAYYQAKYPDAGVKSVVYRYR